MTEDVRPYRITAYTEWETLEVDAACADDQHAVDKARRYATLKHVGTNFPAVIFGHVLAIADGGVRDVGTWEYRLKGSERPGYIWHAGNWSDRPAPDDKASIRRWTTGS